MMNLETELEKRLDEEYKRIKPYLNRKDCCRTLHNMCLDCELYMGLEHDYEECRNRPCLQHYLGYSNLRTNMSYELFPE